MQYLKYIIMCSRLWLEFEVNWSIFNTQVLIHELLLSWGEEGFKKHVLNICQFYKKQRDAMIQALETHLTGELLCS